MPEDDVIRLTYTMDIYGSQILHVAPKVEVPDSPIHMSEKDIDDVLTTVNATPFTPILGGYGQPELSTQDFQCSICENIGHTTDYCNLVLRPLRHCLQHLLYNWLHHLPIHLLFSHQIHLWLLLPEIPYQEI